MSKVIKATCQGSFSATISLNDAELAALSVLRNKRDGNFKLTITAASVDGDIIHITRLSPGGQQILSFNKKDVFGPGMV